jgi:DNA/RNA-binding domain of Phe-tRNA-synthetase-like protein
MGRPGGIDIPLREVEEPIRSGVVLGLLTASPVCVEDSSPALLAEMDALAEGRARVFEGRLPSEISGLAAARELYRSLRIDPTRVRPSSEALLRRVLRGKPLPRILNAVDLCNLCSLEFLLPIGLYDADRIEGAASFRVGRAGESYEGIRKDRVRLDGRPVLVDDAGPFGNPSSDSLRTSVTGSTRALFMIVFAPASYCLERMDRHLQYARERIVRYLSKESDPAEVRFSRFPG